MVETDGDNVVLHDFSWTYDAKDNVTALTESIGGKSFSYTYAYDDDSRPTTFGYGDVTEQITYDGHGRSSGTTVKNGSSTVLGTGYAYRDVDSTYTTTQVKSVTNSYGGKTANFNYTYDANGNILSVSGDQTVTYEYDDLGQLVWEKNAAAGKAWNYTYDNGGNILSRTEYACSSNGTVSGGGTTTSYTYGDAEWGDLLTAYDGEEITYDGIGNPLSYRGWTMSWQGGRQLASLTKGSDTLSFAYNESGLRTNKTVNGVTHSYVWQGSKLAADITDAYALYFHYDATGDVIGFTMAENSADTEYFYVKNLQGDILSVISADGTEAAAYTYDAWGKPLTSTGDLADINPLRYRGYFYDTETSLYYLKSRYYDPEVGRFINPDAYASTGQGILGANMFAYCNNSPVVLTDATGSLSELGSKILGVAFGVFCGAVAAAVVISVAPAAVCALSVGLASWGVSSAAAATIAEVAIFVVGANAAVYGADSGYSAVTGESPMLEAFGGNEDVYETWQIASATSIYGVGALGQYGAQTGVCFIAGTLIATADGQTPIEDIEPGDLVWAWDEETEDVSLKPVVETYVNETDELIHLTVNGEEIVSTPNHPFYSPVKGWTAACKLRAGDILVLVNGDYVVLEKVQHELLESPIRVYNFHVADYHTYFVGEDCVLVHNSCTTQRHHMFSYINKKYTPQFERILSSYGLNTKGSWNIVAMTDHLGRHTYAYHEFMLQQLQRIDRIAGGDITKFMQLYGSLVDYVRSNPGILYQK